MGEVELERQYITTEGDTERKRSSGRGGHRHREQGSRVGRMVTATEGGAEWERSTPDETVYRYRRRCGTVKPNGNRYRGRRGTERSSG